MTADKMQRYAWRQFHVAIVKLDPGVKDSAHHLYHVFHVVSGGEYGLGHLPASRISHLAVLKMEGGGGKQIKITDVVVMHVSDNHVLDGGRINTDQPKALRWAADQLPSALGSGLGAKTDIDNESSFFRN